MARGYVSLYLAITQAERIVRALNRAGTKEDARIAERIRLDIEKSERRRVARLGPLVTTDQRVRVSCHWWERAHCPSCHEDEDYGYDALMEFEIGCIILSVCCDVARELGLTDD